MVAMSSIFTQVEAPAVTPHPFGLFSVAQPASPAGTSWQAGVRWKSSACLKPDTTEDPCISGNTVPAKVVQDCADESTGEFKPFTVYSYFKRSGESFDVARAEAEAVLQGGEEYAVEKHLWEAMAALVPAPDAPSDSAAYPNQLVACLAEVEAQLASNYFGTGVIHMNRGTAAALGPWLIRENGKLHTLTGTPVVAGAGYESTGTINMYGTGNVAVRRGPIDTVEAADMTVNDFYALAERTYVVGWDCFVVGREITLN
jgi:hypothetical protein